MLRVIITIYGTAALCFLQLTSACVISESYDEYLFTVPDIPDYNLMTRDQAQQWCQTSGSVLLEIYDSQMQQNVEKFVNKTREQHQQPMFGHRNMFTSGVRTGAASWMWVNGNNFIAVGDGILNQVSTDYAYGYLLLNQTGLYFVADNSPVAKRNYICEGSKSSECGFSRDGRCYGSYSTTLSWYDARNQCLNGGGDLASFDFVTDQQSLNSLNGSWMTANTPYWIGLRRQWWTWQLADLEIKYTHWQDGHPQTTSDKDCLCLLTVGDRYEWAECNCTENYQFICMKNINEASTPASFSTPMRATTPSVSASVSTYGQFSSVSAVGTNPGNGNSYSSLGVVLGVGLGIGLPLLAVILIMAFIMIRMKRKLSKSETFGISPDNSNRVEMKSTPAYESLQNGTTTTHSSTYQELNITN